MFSVYKGSLHGLFMNSTVSIKSYYVSKTYLMERQYVTDVYSINCGAIMPALNSGFST